MIENIKWLGHGSFAIQGSPSIYIDPWRIVRGGLADIILISHEHYNHCSIADIEKLRGAETKILGNKKVAEKIEDTTIIRPWQSITFDRINIKAIPAYAPNGIKHKEENGGLGFVISMNYYDIYYAGATKIIPEMSRIRPDIVILPIDNQDTLNIQEAVEVVDLLSPRWVIPSNWGSIGTGASVIDANEFKKQVGGRATVIIPTVNTDT